MDVARLNFSHGTHDDHRARHRVHPRRQPQPAEGRGHPRGPLRPEDPRGRLNGRRPRGGAAARSFVLVRGADGSRMTACPCGTTPCTEDLRVGDIIHLDDARMRMRVYAMEGEDVEVHVLVEEGGHLRNGVGVHLPSGNLQLDAHRQGQTRPDVWPHGGHRLRGRVLRAQPRGREARAGDLRGLGPGAAHLLEDRDPAGHRAARRHRGGERRGDGGAGRPGGGVSAGAGSGVAAEGAGGGGGAPSYGHRGDGDVALDGVELAPHARRGQRRGQRPSSTAPTPPCSRARRPPGRTRPSPSA
jgi:hypothetical protein